MIRQIIIPVVLFFCGAGNASSQQNLHNLMKLPPFSVLLRLSSNTNNGILERTTHNIGYGHRIQPGENLIYPITEHQADSLLRNDLSKNCALFRKYGADSLLLGCVSYNCGCTSLLGNNNKPQSMVLTKLDAGNRNILYDLLDFCHYKGKRYPYILRRRWMEYLLLFEY